MTGFSKTSALTTGTLHNIPEDGILHSHSRGKLKYYLLIFRPLSVVPSIRSIKKSVFLCHKKHNILLWRYPVI
jgi:hypothetical protein